MSNQQELYLRHGVSPFAHGFDALDHELEAVAAPFGAGNSGLNIFPGVGIVELLAEFLNVGMDFGVDQEHLAAKPWG